MRRHERGFTIVEVLVALTLLAALLTFSVPPVTRLAAGLRLQLAADELMAALRDARWQAIRLGIHVAVKFRPEPDGRATYTIYRDGDGDGVLNKDISRGVDRAVAPPRRVEQLGRDIRFGFPDRPAREPGSRRLLRPGDDPIRFNQSDLASFGPLGTSTPGSLYLTDGRERLVAVRVFGRTGKVKVMVYDFAEGVWR